MGRLHLNMIKVIYNKPAMLNKEKFASPLLASETRQWCSPCPVLFNLGLKILTGATRPKK